MLDFEFYNPTRIVFGRDRLQRLDALVPATARVLILYGGESARRYGTIARVRQALGARHVEEFGGIEANPTYETLMRAVQQVRTQAIDFLLAVGGGSVIDGSKFVAAAAVHSGDALEILSTHGRQITQALPLGCVLTLPATGSEMNSGAVVTHQAKQAKLAVMNPALFPRFSLLDPSLTLTLPARQVANGVVDAFVHIMEQYLTYPVHALAQDRFAEGLLQSLIEIGPRTLAAPEDEDARANLVWIATLALNGLIGAGVPQDWSTHMIGHELTALHGIDHARTLAVILPANLSVRRAAKHDKLLQYATRVWQLSTGDATTRIDTAIAKTRDFFESLGVPTHLSNHGLGAGHIDAIIANLQEHGMVHLGERQDVTPEVSRRILEASL